MSTATQALSKARGDAQALHSKIQVTTSKDHTAIRMHLEEVAKQAQALSQSVKDLTESQEADARQHLRDAATVLDGAAHEAKDLANAGKSDVRESNIKLLAKATIAARLLSRALAAARANKKLVRS
ncbi:MAG TPA: hypothetical protein VGG89_14140 [Candidatus Baltobacteraceae bacterium]|jgi:hypothetical protein